MIARAADLPFRERPLLELLNVARDRDAPDPEYAGYGWARAPRLWLVAPEVAARHVDDALVLALHCPDDGEALERDVELYFELPDGPPVTVLASTFLRCWLPRLPRDVSAIVLALCNPQRASVPRPRESSVPLHFAQGEVESWIGRHDDRLELRAPAWVAS